MKKTLSLLAVLGIVSVFGIQSANAFSWSSLNPWSKCKCKQEKKCPTGYAAPCPCTTPQAKNCDPCNNQEIEKPAPCDACDRLQQEMQNK